MLAVHPSPPAIAPRVYLVPTRALSPTLRLSFVVTLVVVLGSAVVAYRNSRRSMEMSASVAHSQEVRAELAKLLSDLEGAQGRQRTIRLHEGDDIEGARRLIASGVSTNAMTRVRTTIARMERNETDLLAHRSRAVNGTARAATVTFVATGKIKITSPSIDLRPYSQGILLYSNLGSGDGVTFKGANSGSWGGVVYTPHSNIAMGPFDGVTVSGSMVGWTISTTGSSETATYDSSFFPQETPAEITLYK